MAIIRFVCPDCGKDFRAGPEMRPGPGQARCGKCGCVFNTGLKNWNEYSAGEKLLLVVKVLLNPFYAKNPLEWFYDQWLMLMFFGALSIGVSYLLRPRGNNAESFMIIAFFVLYFGFHGIRLIRRIVICRECAKTSEPPTWE